MTEPLFDGLPAQEPPTFRETDEHLLEPCDKCGGSGKWFFWEDGRQRHAPCQLCAGVGKRIRYLGPIAEPPTPPDPRDPDHTRVGIFVHHNCWKCSDGTKACANGNPSGCDYPHARND